MNNRRDFLKAGVAVTAGSLVLGALPAASAGSGFPAGLIYSAAAPGRWAGKQGSHAPQVERDGDRITITTAHPMSQAHYIVRHTLIAANGETLGEKTFFPSDKRAVSVFTVPAGQQVRYATSFCNKHDFWVTEI